MRAEFNMECNAMEWNGFLRTEEANPPFSVRGPSLACCSWKVDNLICLKPIQAVSGFKLCHT